MLTSLPELQPDQRSEEGQVPEETVPWKPPMPKGNEQCIYKGTSLLVPAHALPTIRMAIVLLQR